MVLQVAHLPPAQALALPVGRLRPGEGRARLAGQARLEGGKVAALVEDPAIRVDHAHVHEQVPRQLGGVPGVQRYGDPGHALELAAQDLRERALPRRDAVQHRAGEVRRRHEVLAQRLGQGPDQGGGLLLHQAGDQPLQAVGVELVERGHGHDHGDAVVVVARLELVGERQLHTVDIEVVRVIRAGDLPGLALHELLAAHAQALVIAVPAHPALEARAVHHLRRQALIVEGAEHRFVDEHVAAAGLRLQRLHSLDHLAVVGQARGMAVEAAADQGLVDEHPPRGGGVHAGEVDLAAAGKRQAVEGDILVARHPPAALLPEGLVVLAADEVRGDGLDPLRTHLRDGAREHPRRLHQLGGDDPFGPPPCEPGAREDRQRQAARAGIAAVLPAQGHIGHQPGEQGLVQGLVVRRLLVLAPAAALEQVPQLAVDVPPLAHAQVREEVLAAPGAQLALGEVARLLVKVVPQPHHREEVRALVLPAPVRLVRGLPGLHGALARVLHG
ncbi:hypothetical protein KBTX_00925 [wastewater metagenome]|uniref:Uncharacterized protein n=2 Tax=unclassified sequences TaxID=12908 RepID=A0A5B8RD31_9ZZZZ|nr:hypothetical protein KBTEX_00925 [uncultured organism]